MTTFTATPSNVQTRINALLPGDTLILSDGTYSSFSIGVSGTADQPIIIRGNEESSFDIFKPLQYSNVLINGPVTITGSYLNIALLCIQSGTRGFDINGARHIAMERCFSHGVSNEAYWIRNNSQYIHLYNSDAGTAPGGTSGQNDSTKTGFRVGTPSGSWSGGVPDETSYVLIRFAWTTWISGHGHQLHEGAHHIVIQDCEDDHSGTDAANTQHDSYNSSASHVQIMRCFAGTAPRYAYYCSQITVNGVLYGQDQEVYLCGFRDPGFDQTDNSGGAFASNCPDFRVYYPYLANQSNTAATYVELDGATWTNGGVIDVTEFLTGRPSDAPTPLIPGTGVLGIFDPITWSSPAQEWAVLYPQGPGEFGLFIHHRGQVCQDGQNAANNYMEYGEFYISEDITKSVAVKKVGYWQGHVGQRAVKGAFFEASAERDPDTLLYGTLIPNTTFDMPAAKATGGWNHVTLPEPFIVKPGKRYWIGLSIAGGNWPPSVTGKGPIYMGLVPNGGYWSNGYGKNGADHGLVHAPNGWNSTMAFGYTNFQDQQRADTNPGTPFQPISFWPGNYLIDVIVGYFRNPMTFNVGPDDNLQAVLNDLIPGDIVIISGTHEGTFVVRISGSETRPITIKGDGTAVLRTRWGTDGVQRCLRVIANYILLENIIVESAGLAVLVEECNDVKLRQITARTTRGAGIVCRAALNIYHESCTVQDTGTDLNTGDGFRCGTLPGSWPGGDPNPDAIKNVRYDNCVARRILGDGFDIDAAANTVVLKDCSVDHTLGNIPSDHQVSGTAGFHSRGDKVQFVNCVVNGAPGAGFEPFDTLWALVTYGRGQEVKAGMSMGHVVAGVSSQSEGMKVFSDFTATPAPRIKEVAGGWAAAGSNVAPSSFRELTWSSPAATY